MREHPDWHDETATEYAERIAQEMLGVSAAEAYRQIDRGDLVGTLAESALQSARWLGGA